MSSNILQHNADVLFNDLVIVNQNSSTKYVDKKCNLSVDSDGRLFTISKFNFIGRLIKWFANLDGSVDKQINLIVLRTLESIKDCNSMHAGQPQNMIYLTIKSRKIFFNTDYYSSHYPAYYLGERILACQRFQTPQIRTALEDIKESDYAPASRGDGAAPLDPKVWSWDAWDQHFGDWTTPKNKSNNKAIETTSTPPARLDLNAAQRMLSGGADALDDLDTLN